ncbi:MAG: hypothetical protein GAK30_00901 [Paracidovorax wautersii]|uniref:Uncharacterized protein n=1 Tax=Paracidovorax wautersii TaxID=1177982 RepID=A0A7V8FQT0_9BURK|nr:MAG: hypothetical protein GAK30_00901 [Paracidovorax wautersii]
MQNVSDMNEPKFPGKNASGDYVIEAHGELAAVPADEWDALLARQTAPTPFMRHAFLSALHASGSACSDTGWTPLLFTLRDDTAGLQAAALLYLKPHSYGEYVFDWAWAEAYARHGLDYYPKAVVAVPFTPVPGSRILATSDDARTALLRALVHWSREQGLSSLHLLLGSDDDLQAARAAGLMLRDGVQFHWHNRRDRPYADFDDFLGALSHDKRKKIRQERRKVAEAGVTFRCLAGGAITTANWDFFYRCYEQTYLEHGNAPYLSRDFFARVARDLAPHWVMFVAEREGRAIAASLIGIAHGPAGPAVAYGRYWGALESVSCLHFDACYYQPIAWCIAHGVQRFEGGAQGEHKMARALLPAPTASAHWLAHPAFAEAVGDFLARESHSMAHYVEQLRQRSPLRQSD